MVKRTLTDPHVLHVFSLQEADGEEKRKSENEGGCTQKKGRQGREAGKSKGGREKTSPGKNAAGGKLIRHWELKVMFGRGEGMDNIYVLL